VGRRKYSILVDVNNIVILLNITYNLPNFIKGTPIQIIKNEK